MDTGFFDGVDWPGLLGKALAAVAILVITWIVAMIVKSLFTKLSGKIPALQRAGAAQRLGELDVVGALSEPHLRVVDLAGQFGTGLVGGEAEVDQGTKPQFCCFEHVLSFVVVSVDPRKTRRPRTLSWVPRPERGPSILVRSDR